MLRAYIKRILGYVQPDGTVDEESLEAGFQALDRNRDGKIMLEDLVHFAKVQQNSCNGSDTQEEIPDGFMRYTESSKKLQSQHHWLWSMKNDHRIAIKKNSYMAWFYSFKI